MEEKLKMVHSGWKPTLDKSDLPEDNIIVFDTNVLLNMYFIEDINYLEIYINIITEYIWCPSQVWKEYEENRTKKISEIRDRIDKLKDFEKKIKIMVDNQLKEYKDLPTYHGKLIRRIVEDRLEGVSKFIESNNEELNNIKIQIGKYNNKENDKVYNLISKIFKNKGEFYTEDELKSIENEANERYSKEIPPGYKDNDKLDNKYGDYILWRQMIDKSKLENKNIILVSNENKEDWRDNNKNCRKELIEEFKQLTDRNFKLVTLDELVGITHKFSDMKNYIDELRENDKSARYDKKMSNKSYSYYESLENITLGRRTEEFCKTIDEGAYLGLFSLRKQLEYYNERIFCSYIFQNRYDLAIDILFLKDKVLKNICKINYMVCNDFSIFIEYENGKSESIAWKGDGVEDHDKSIDTYNEKIINSILKYIDNNIQ